MRGFWVDFEEQTGTVDDSSWNIDSLFFAEYSAPIQYLGRYSSHM